MKFTWAEDGRLRGISFRGPAADEDDPARTREGEWHTMWLPDRLRSGLATGPGWLLDVLALARLAPQAPVVEGMDRLAFTPLPPWPLNPVAAGNAFALDTSRKTLDLLVGGTEVFTWLAGDDKFALQGMGADATPEQVEGYVFWLLSAVFLPFEVLERTANPASSYIRFRTG
jgi:hypothetical protein